LITMIFEWQVKSRTCRRRSVLLTLLIILLAPLSWSLAADYVIVQSGRGTYATPGFALRHAVAGDEAGPPRRRTRHQRGSLQLFSDTISLIREHFPGDISDAKIFSKALENLTLTLLPHCTEHVRPIAECSGDPAECYLDAIESIAHRCNIPTRQLIVMALGILLRNLDANSALMDPRMLDELKISTSGKFGGVGMVVSSKGGDYVVISCLEGSPAYRADIKPGDTVMAIDGEPLHGLPLPQVLSKVRGRAGSRISLSIKMRGTETVRDVSLRRRIIRVPPVRHHMLDGGIGYIRIVNFQESTSREVAKALRKLFRSSPSGLKGLILDLRANPGGLFEQAIKVADLLLPSDIITVVKGRGKRLNKEFRARRQGTFPSVPMVVLVDRGTASAAEILAAALQNRPDVLVMGERSFGKASVQGIFLLRTGGMALRLTTAHYYAPDGRDIDRKGIKPDVLIKQPETHGELGSPPAVERKGLDSDRVVSRASDYLRSSRSARRSPFPSWY
jgi:carboxyl-terminal processing protease